MNEIVPKLVVVGLAILGIFVIVVISRWYKKKYHTDFQPAVIEDEI